MSQILLIPNLPKEFDDPNTTITNILDIVRQMGVSIDFAPSKLKQGYGEQAIFVLDRLSDETLRWVLVQVHCQIFRMNPQN